MFAIAEVSVSRVPSSLLSSSTFIDFWDLVRDFSAFQISFGFPLFSSIDCWKYIRLYFLTKFVTSHFVRLYFDQSLGQFVLRAICNSRSRFFIALTIFLSIQVGCFVFFPFCFCFLGICFFLQPHLESTQAHTACRQHRRTQMHCPMGSPWDQRV